MFTEIPDETMVMGKYKVQLYDPNTKAYGDYPTIGMHVEVKDPEEKVIWFNDNKFSKLIEGDSKQIVHQRRDVHIHFAFTRRTSHLSLLKFDCLV